MMPPIPGWEGLHPLVVHFPVAGLLLAPVLIVLGLLLPKLGRPMLISGLVLMGIGALGAWTAVLTGEAAGQLVERTPEINKVLLHHATLAESTAQVFTLLTLLYAALLFVPGFMRKTLAPKVVFTLLSLFLVVYMGSTLLVVNTAHQGGRLVHQYGVHAMMPTE